MSPERYANGTGVLCVCVCVCVEGGGGGGGGGYSMVPLATIKPSGTHMLTLSRKCTFHFLNPAASDLRVAGGPLSAGMARKLQHRALQ